VREHGAHAYDFSHDKLREVAYSRMSAARRRLLHRRIAQALETLHAADLGSVSHLVASHYERAGLPERAAPHYLRAAQVARQVFANQDAMALLRRGLALLEGEGPGGALRCRDVAALLWEELADVLELLADHEQALEAYHKAQAAVLDEDRIGQARLHRKIGAVMREERRYGETLQACHLAEIALGEQPGDDADGWWAEWLEVRVDRVWTHYWLAQWPEMEELVNNAQPVVQARAGAASRQRFLMATSLLHLRKERYRVTDEMLADSRQALAASLEWGDRKAMADSHFELGFLHLWRRELDEAKEHLQAALERAGVAGFAWMLTLSLTYLSVLWRFRGQPGEVLSHARRARQAAEAAHMPDYVAAAKANQAWLAWRRGDLSAVEQLGKEALDIWRQSPLVYPFQWQALWPLLGVALADGREDEAWLYAQALLEPRQQLLPDALNSALETALQAHATDQPVAARSHVERALQLAQEMGYL